MNKFLNLASICLFIFSCSQDTANPIYDPNIKRTCSKYTYNNMRFVCVHETENDVSTYSRSYIDVLDIINTDILGDICTLEIRIDFECRA